MIKAIYERLPKLRLSLMLTSLVALIVLEVTMTCLIPTWREYFYNILQNKNQVEFITALVYFFVLMLGLGVAQGLKVWAGQLMAVEIRTMATKVLFKPWVKGGAVVKNYTQAMTEAIRNVTELAIEITAECVISLAIVVILIVQSLHNAPIVIASIVYTLVASGAAALFNRPLTLRDKESQEAEGRLRESFSDIANGNGDYSYKTKLASVIDRYYAYIKITMWFTLFTRVKSSVSSLVPYLLLAGPFFAGTISLGDFMGGAAVFDLIVINSTILILLYPKITKAKASYQLAKEFYLDTRKESNNVL